MIDENRLIYYRLCKLDDFPIRPLHKVGNPKKRKARKAQKKARRINRNGK